SQALLPVLGNSSGILSRFDGFEYRLIYQQIGYPLQFEIVRIELVQSRRQFDPQLRRVQSIPPEDDQVDAFATLAGKVAGERSENDGHEADTLNGAPVHV